MPRHRLSAAPRTAPLLAATALATTLLSAGGASAACVSGPSDILCTGTETAPVSDVRNNLAVTVEPGAEVVVDTDDAITLAGDDNTVVNSGRIEATDSGDEALQYSGDRLSVQNAAGALIRGGDKGLERDGGTGLTLVNAGTIRAVDDAVRDDGGAVDVTNELGGLIESTEEKGLRVRGAGTTVTNHGTIRAAGEAVEGRDGFTLVNTGLIEATGDDAVQFGDGTLTNEAGGIIRGGDDGVDVDSGTIVNRGLITTTAGDSSAAAIDVDPDAESGGPAGALSILNEGTISAVIAILFDPASTAAQTILNRGLIEGTGGTAISFAPTQGAVDLTLEGNSVIRGDVLFGGADDLMTVNDITSGTLIASAFDGGLGTDTARFGTGYAAGDLLRVRYLGPDSVRLVLAAENGDRLRGVWTGFERFEIDGETYGFDDLGTLAPVPLPGALGLLAAALAGLGALRRRG